MQEAAASLTARGPAACSLACVHTMPPGARARCIASKKGCAGCVCVGGWVGARGSSAGEAYGWVGG